MIPVDEINALLSSVQTQAEEKRLSAKELEDAATDLLLLCYIYGCADAEEQLGGEKKDISPTAVKDALSEEYGGETYIDRLREYAEAQDFEGIKRVLETESHRIYNTAVYETGRGRATTKTWITAADDRVRETHEYLLGITVPYEAEFYTFDGDTARFPGDFSRPENNVNCRCILSLGRE